MGKVATLAHQAGAVEILSGLLATSEVIEAASIVDWHDPCLWIYKAYKVLIDGGSA